jgi:anti-sigma B factor antagonist
MTHQLDARRDGRCAIVSASGEFDAFAAPDLRAALLQAADAEALVCDLSGVAFMDSTALGVVVGAFKRAREDGHELHVVLPAGTARRVFEITTLDRVLPIAPTLDDALRASGA